MEMPPIRLVFTINTLGTSVNRVMFPSTLQNSGRTTLSFSLM